MNLICITESELAQWVNRKHFDTLIARVLTEQTEVTSDIFSTAPFLKLDDARGRVLVNLKDEINNKIKNCIINVLLQLNPKPFSLYNFCKHNSLLLLQHMNHLHS